MAGLQRLGWTVFRSLYALYFLFVGVTIVRMLMVHGPGVVQPNPASAAFMGALRDSGFMLPAMAATYLLGGLALIVPRTAPLGVVLLAPVVGIILLFHLNLTGRVLWGGGWALGLALLAWHYRGSYVGLWSRRD
jgi:hypothetical protein